MRSRSHAHHPARLLNGLRSAHQEGRGRMTASCKHLDDLSAVQPGTSCMSCPRRRAAVEWQGAACHRQPSRPSGILEKPPTSSVSQQTCCFPGTDWASLSLVPADNQRMLAVSEGHCALRRPAKSRDSLRRRMSKICGPFDNGRRLPIGPSKTVFPGRTMTSGRP